MNDINIIGISEEFPKIISWRPVKQTLTTTSSNHEKIIGTTRGKSRMRLVEIPNSKHTKDLWFDLLKNKYNNHI